MLVFDLFKVIKMKLYEFYSINIKENFFEYSINMSNIQQNKIQNEIEQIKKERNLLQDRLKKNEKSQSISKWVNGNQKNTSKKGKKVGFFSNQRNTKYSEEYISKQNRANQNEYKSTTKYTYTSKKRKILSEKGLKKIAKMQNLS